MYRHERCFRGKIHNTWLLIEKLGVKTLTKSGAWKHSLSTGVGKPGRAIGLVRTLTVGTYQGEQIYKYTCSEDN